MIGARFFAAAGAGVFATFVLFGSAAEAAPPGWEVIPKRPHHGEIVRLSMNVPPGAAGGSFTLDGRKFLAFISGERMHAYVGIDLDVKPGTYDVTYEASGVTGTVPFEVFARDYATERLKVNRKYTELAKETQERVAREKKDLDRVFALMTSTKLWTKAFLKPTIGALGSPFGLRRFFNGKPRSPHSGLDIRAGTGTEIMATNCGTVVLADDLFFTGKTVAIDHGLGLITYYAHMSRIDVKVGDEVHRAQLLGLVGATGRVTGPHLHWGVKVGGARVDPETLPGLVM